MKPDWKDAPEWAKWLAMDEDGEWFWFENKPEREGGWGWDADGRLQRDREALWADPPVKSESSLEEKPE